MLGLWAVLTLTGALYSAWLGYGGRAFAATLTAFAFFFLVMLLLAARGVENSIASRFGAASGHLLGAAVFLVYLIYALGTNTFALTRAAAVAGLVFFPLALAASAKQKSPGAWQDFLILAGVWVAVKPLPNRWGWSLSHWFWPYPGGWGHHWSFFITASFIVFGCIAIPLGQAMHFMEFAPQWSQLKSLPFLFLGIFFFTAWPEEFLFRGLLQNMLSRASNNELAGWWTASILFGFSHITNMGFPNWRYVVMASIAGFFYGWTWRKTSSIFASALVHAAVDITWHFFF